MFEDDIIDDIENEDVKPKKKRKRVLSSYVWKYFTKTGPETAQCNACKQEFMGDGSKYGTSSLRHLLKTCEETKKNGRVAILRS